MIKYYLGLLKDKQRIEIFREAISKSVSPGDVVLDLGTGLGTFAFFAAKAGATFVSPFIGRLDDISHVGMEIIHQIRTIYDNYGFITKIIVASVRNPLHVVDAALAGADIATIPPAVIDQLFKHPLTDIGIEKFLSDWEKVPKK